MSAALVLGSGGARAAYEVGVARFLFEDLRRAHRAPLDLRILCGTSAGALNALALAAFAGDPLDGVAYLARRWTDLRLDGVIRPHRFRMLRLAGTLVGYPPSPAQALQVRGAILDPRPFRKLAADLPVDAIAEHFRAGRLDAVSFTATEIATGRTVVFQQTRAAPPRSPSSRATQVVSAAGIHAEHAFASAAIPLLFPPVRIGGRLYCDGSLRQSVPLSPALHAGATRIVAVSTQHLAPRVSPSLEHEREDAASSPLYLLGKAVNALTLDRIDDDLERLGTINQIIQAGTRAFGAAFLGGLNRELQAAGSPALRPVHALLLRPSESIGRIAADHVRGRHFRSRMRGSVGRVLGRFAEAESEHEADLVSYLLFDGPFAGALIDLGYADARSRRDELAALLLDEPAADEVSARAGRSMPAPPR